ncbi:MAG: NYN domain-containing protein, partial [Oligosphaeraceae bacterium]
MTKLCCDEALKWALNQFAFKDFHYLIRTIPELHHVLTKGGFTLSERNYRKEGTTQRILATLRKHPDLCLHFLLALAQVFRHDKEVEKTLQENDGRLAWEGNWREKYSQMTEPRHLILALFRSNSRPRLARLTDLLLHAPSLWRGKKNPVTCGRKLRLRQEQRRCLQTLEKLADREPAPGDPQEGKMMQPELQGLLPLAPAAPAAPETKAEPPAEPKAAPPPEKTPELPPAPVADSPDDKEEKGLKEQLRRARQKNDELSREIGNLRREARSQQAIGEKERKAQQETLQKQSKELEELREDFDDAIQELQEEFAEVQKKQMASFYAETLGIHPDRISFYLKARNEERSLSSEVDQLLARQKEYDKKYGLLQDFEKECANLDRQLGRVRQAINQAIRLAPGMTELEKKLENRLNELRTQLHTDPGDEENPLYEGVFPRLYSYLKELPPLDDATPAAMDEVEAFLKGNLARNLFLPAELESMEACLKERRHLVRKMRESAALLAQARNVPEKQATQERMGWIILNTCTREQLKEVELFIDGYNVMKQDPVMSLEEKSARGFPSTRSKFLSQCKRASRFFKNVTLVFDGDLGTDNIGKEAENLSVVYAARKRFDQNADNWIVNRMVELEAKDQEAAGEDAPAPRWLVTNDMGLRSRVAQLCDGYVDNSSF